MTVDEVKNHRFWVDEDGEIWERTTYCLEPTVTFELLQSSGPHEAKSIRRGGAIGCLNVSELKPIKDERLKE